MYEFVKHIKISNLISQCVSNFERRHHKEISTILSTDSLHYFVLVEFARDAINPTLHGSKRTGWVDPPCDVSTKKVLLDGARWCLLVMIRAEQQQTLHEARRAFQISCCDGSILLLHCTLWSNSNICLNSCPRKDNIFDRMRCFICLLEQHLAPN